MLKSTVSLSSTIILSDPFVNICSERAEPNTDQNTPQINIVGRQSYQDRCGEYREAKLRVKEIVIDICVYPEGQDAYVSEGIARAGIFDKDIVIDFYETLNSGDLSGVVLDIGANVGEFSAVASSLGYYVFSFDPVINHTNMISRTVDINDWDSLTLLRNALGDKRNKSEIAIPHVNKGAAFIERGIPLGSTQEIDIIRLDDVYHLIKEKAKSIAVMKVDIEGYELLMLRGAKRIFNLMKPKVIYMEFQRYAEAVLMCEMDDGIQALGDLGYIIYVLKNHIWQEIPNDLSIIQGFVNEIVDFKFILKS